MYKKHSALEYELVMDLKRKNPKWGDKNIFLFLFNQGINIKQNVIASWLYSNKKPFEEVLIIKISEALGCGVGGIKRNIKLHTNTIKPRTIKDFPR